MKIYFGGSRSLSPSFFSFVAGVVGLALRRGFCVSVGCAAGADAAVVRAVMRFAGAASRLSVAAVGSSCGAGFWRGSAPLSLLRSAASRGAAVVWSAGGSLSLPLRARLLRRSLAGAAGCSFAVFFLASPSSAGSLAVASRLASRGADVFAFSCGFSGPPAPLSGVPGAWVPVRRLFGSPAWRWSVAAVQPRLF